MNFNKSIYQLLGFAILFLGLISISRANETVVQEPTPAWVSTVNLPNKDNAPQNQAKNGVYYLLVDRQIKVDNKQKPHYYHRYADYVINQAGVENNSQINIDYDPTYQTLVLHSLHLRRGQQIIDKMASSRMTFIQREEDLDTLIYNGRETLNIILDDVRVGDIIEYSYSREGMNPAYKNIFAYSSALNWSVPVGKFSLRLLWHKPTPLQYRFRNSQHKLTHTKTDHGSEYNFQNEWVESLNFEENTPSWFDPKSRVFFSELKSWEEVINWSEGYYQNAMEPNQEVKRLIQSIQLEHKGLNAQIAAALHFVQDEIRYLGIELNENSHVPTPAFETLANRYGDCKDKTVLFLTLLQGLGVKGYPALVNTEDNLQGVLPNVQAFNHVITYFEHQGKRYWVDPTLSYQHGNLDALYQPDYGLALLLLKGLNNLTPMQPTQANYGVLVDDRFVIPSEGMVDFYSSTKDVGWNAERQRKRLAENSSEQMQADYLDFFQGYYSNIKSIKPIQHTDDTDANILTSREHYQIENFWQDKPDRKYHEANFYANIVSSYLDIPDQKARSYPLYLTYPQLIEQRISVDFEDDNWAFDNESFVENNDFFRFSHEVNFNKNDSKLTLVYRYQSKVDHVAPEHYQAYVTALNNAKNNLSYSIVKYYQTEESGLSWLLQYVSVASVTTTYVSLYLLVILLWRIERRKQPNENQAVFYPVSILKLCAMWVLTFGVYGIYWFYKNFQYIKHQEKNSSMPWARALFNLFWYYPLWRKLKADNEQRFDSNHLPTRWLSIVLAFSFFVVEILAEQWDFTILFLLVSCLLIVPLANYIVFANGHESPALVRNSNWSFRHYLLVFLSLPLVALQGGSSIGLVPSDSVVKGSWLLEHNIKSMQRQGIILPSDTIDYFYSDAFLFVSDDGNGFTQRHVFSYWKGEDQAINKELASYDDVKDIKVDWAKGTDSNSTLTIVRRDGSKFVLYVSNADNKDKAFVTALKKHWQNHH